jgi:hypothetical protein|tara:strand:+ start:5197 stop:5379 length:183 start_codon:yes stop_codon:yes gene_type:complete
MKRLAALAVLLGVVFFASTVSTAQPENVSTLSNRLSELYSQGRYTEAVLVADKVIIYSGH